MNAVSAGRGALCKCCYCCSPSGCAGKHSQAGRGRLEQTEDLERCCLSDSTLAAGEAPPEPLISFACLNMLFRQFYFSIPLLIPSIFFIAFTLLPLRGLVGLHESISPAKHLKILGRRMLWQCRTLLDYCRLWGAGMRSWLTTKPVVTSYSDVQQPFQIWSCTYNDVRHPGSFPCLKSLSGEN